jgi:hypothetical protein
MKAPMGKIDDSLKGQFNIQIPIQQMTKYTQTLAQQAGKIKVRK